MNLFADQVKRKLQLDGIGEFKAPKSKCIRSSYAAKDIHSSYTGGPCMWCFRVLQSRNFRIHSRVLI